MAIAQEYPHIEKPGVEPARLRSHPRVRVAQIVMDYLTHGWSAEEMCRQHPYMRPSEAHSAMAYYFDHQDEIDAEIEAERLQVEHERRSRAPSALVQRLRAQGLV